MTAPTRPARLRRSVLYTILGNGIYLASQYGMLMVIAKLGDQVLVGEFSLVLALISPPLVFSQMQLRQVFVTDSRKSVPFAGFFWTRAVTGIPTLALTLIAIALLGYSADFLLVTGLLGIAKVAESQSDIVYGSLQRRERMDLVAGSLAVRGVLGLTAVGVGLWQTGSLVGAALALAATWGGLLLAMDLVLLRLGNSADRLRWRWDANVIRELVRTSLPLTTASGLVSLSASVPRYFLEIFSGKPAVALYAVAMTPISLMGLFTGSVSQATLARASVYLQNDRFAAFSALARRLAAINVLIGAALVGLLLLAGRPLVRLLFTPEYEPAVPVMVLLGIGVALSGLAAFGSTVAAAGRRFTVQLANVVVALLVQVPLCWLLVPRLGVAGAAWSELGKFLATTIFLHWSGRRIYRTLVSSQPVTT
jgi:O-antigen/teichoic acid export membrane protein